MSDRGRVDATAGSRGVKSGASLIAFERRRQRSRGAKGEFYSLSHDDDHDRGELACAAAVYAIPPEFRRRNDSAWRAMWPPNWRVKFSPDDRIRELVKAGALIAAEIDRLQRAALPSVPAPQATPPSVANPDAGGGV